MHVNSDGLSIKARKDYRLKPRFEEDEGEAADAVAECHLASPGPDRWKKRSTTYPGIADAIAEQWGSL